MTRLWSASTALGARLDRGARRPCPLTMFDEAYLGMDAPTRRLFQEELLADYVEPPHDSAGSDLATPDEDRSASLR